VQFSEYVGAIQIGNLVISVLPKADNRNLQDESEKERWNQLLIDMLRAVHGFEVKASSESQLSTRKNSILDLYVELLIKDLEYILRAGLVKKYRSKTGNLFALKGNLQLSKQISKNLIHKERFFTRHTVYDTEHLLHIILYQTLKVVKQINSNKDLNVRINNLLLDFPEMPTLSISEATFNKVKFNRKTNHYQRSVTIARLILLQYHPNLVRGKQDVLALMFDMNALWEQFVLVSLKQNKGLNVKGQNSKLFWKPTGGSSRSIRPDIVLSQGGLNYILDTKWKLVTRKPSIDDLRQMYAYHQFFKADKVALLYPGQYEYLKGNFTQIDNPKLLSDMECGLLFTEVDHSIKAWQRKINKQVETWINKPSFA
tara:strand:- start:841 stop:1950 length:1110 start_codon:yes stop_codon:yes gene_type:complete